MYNTLLQKKKTLTWHHITFILHGMLSCHCYKQLPCKANNPTSHETYLYILKNIVSSIYCFLHLPIKYIHTFLLPVLFSCHVIIHTTNTDIWTFILKCNNLHLQTSNKETLTMEYTQQEFKAFAAYVWNPTSSATYTVTC